MFSPEFVTSVTATRAGLVIGLRLNWFRALPLSCVEELSVSVDGTRLDPGVLSLDGRAVEAAALGSEDDTWWRVLSDAALTLAWAPPEHPVSVRVTMRTRIPLLLDHTGSPVVVVDSAVVEVAA